MNHSDPPNLPRPAKNVLKIDSCSAWGTLTNFPCKLRLNFFIRPWGTDAPTAPPGCAYGHGSTSQVYKHLIFTNLNAASFNLWVHGSFLSCRLCPAIEDPTAGADWERKNGSSNHQCASNPHCTNINTQHWYTLRLNNNTLMLMCTYWCKHNLVAGNQSSEYCKKILAAAAPGRHKN